ncbi:Cyclin-Y [Fasciola gigantica]|uniref:Cyclin-Y n=2 Tax=Fasciola TaxID=6191 RepID=A0A4E0RU34_FASHE|nr:Cyclin-Y [Fasciola hepatica]TPP65173.1 Cyclin-Y [Fasciola gigantica]
MGNHCSPCCRKSHKSLREDGTSNYGSASNHAEYGHTKAADYYPNIPKDPRTGYPLVPGGPVGVNGELRHYQTHLDTHLRRSTDRSDPTAMVSGMGDGRSRRYRLVGHPAGSNTNAPGVGTQSRYVIVTEPSDYMLSSLYTQSSTSNLQHISEREPDDTEADPSLNPMKETLFMQRSIRDVEASFRKRRSIYDRNVSRYRLLASCPLYRSSSTSTVRLDDSTVTRPDPKSTVRALSHAVYLQIKNRDRYCPNTFMPEIFDERVHPVQNEPVPADYGNQDPDQKVVYRFIRTLFQMAQLSPECAIVTMVYLERLLTSAETELTPATWKRIVLCAILLASKVWDDQAVWNVDYCQILKDLNVNDVNELERQFLEIIQFNINVPSSVYAKYYFDIRSLCGASCHPFPLSMERAYKLEAYSRVMEDTFHEDFQRAHNQRRWGSLDTLTSPPRFRPAVLC